MGLVPADAVDDVAARLIQPPRPADVRLLVETRQQLDEDGHLLAVLRGPGERPDDRRVAARPVEGLLDREHVGVVRGRGDERHHRVLLPGSDLEKQALARIPWKRFGEHGELTNLVAYLLSDASPYQTGDEVTIDGAEALFSGQQSASFGRPASRRAGRT